MKRKKIVPSKDWERVKVRDFYQAAYLMSIGAVVVDVELVPELDKDVCILTFSGEQIQSHLKTYLNNQALVNPLLYQRAVNRVREIVFHTLDNAADETQDAPKSSNQGGTP